ncbi:39S ribosomal protein L16, mitochondrial [Anabarilius grahami]|uniref:Large ribosomal subunit protein uL16m n=1 Tax=Anabarilius grahami TaxID=495550 RepID=A0A3N0YGK4_ANAGA|nr:39S ribosomal protein L16, mitochondrial [Anabarilius grahami]
MKVLSAGLRTYEVPPDFSDVVLPEKTKLKFLEKVPNLKQAKKEMKKLRDIQGPAKSGNTFTKGQYGIVALGGGYLHWGHMEMMRLTINRRIDPSTTFALWRFKAPHKPITRKGLGQRMGGGKGAIDHYVTPVKCGRLVVEVGGRVELGEVKAVLTEVAKKLPFPAKALGGGYLHWGHMEMMRLTINRRIDPSTTFALWRFKAPHKPITRKGLGQRMGGGKGAIDHYVTPVKCGRLVVEVGGRVELGEVKAVLTEVAKKLPFPAKVVSRESLAALHQEQAERETNNQNPWTFQRVARANMLGIRKVLSPFDIHNHGRYAGKFFYPKRV